MEESVGKSESDPAVQATRAAMGLSAHEVGYGASPPEERSGSCSGSTRTEHAKYGVGRPGCPFGLEGLSSRTRRTSTPTSQRLIVTSARAPRPVMWIIRRRQVSWLTGRCAARPSQGRDPSGVGGRRSPLTVAGAASALAPEGRTDFPFKSRRTPSWKSSLTNVGRSTHFCWA